MKPLRRYDALDSLRGVCACMVVLFHFKPYSHFLHASLIRHSYLFVDFFFVLSGFVIFEAYRDRLRAGFGLKRFMLLRLGRIYPLHLFVLLGFVVYECAWMLWLSRYSPQPRPAFSGENSLPALVANLFMAQSFGLLDGTSWNYPAWSIGAEFWTYILFALAIVRTPAPWLAKGRLRVGADGMGRRAGAFPGPPERRRDERLPALRLRLRAWRTAQSLKIFRFRPDFGESPALSPGKLELGN